MSYPVAFLMMKTTNMCFQGMKLCLNWSGPVYQVFRKLIKVNAKKNSMVLCESKGGAL